MESIVIHFFTYVDKNKILNINILLMCLLKKKKRQNEKESLPYLQKCALNIRNNNEGPRLLENTARLTRLQTPSVLLPPSLLPPPFTPQTDPFIPLKKLFDIQC